MNHRLLFPAWFGMLLTTVLISLTLGRYPVTLPEIYGYLAQTLLNQGKLTEQHLQTLRTILFDIRMPRIMAAILVGSALSVSGAAFQSMFINPLVSPGLLGVLAGASFGAALGMVVSKSWLAVQAGAFGFGLAAVAVALGLARLYQGDRLLLLVMGGIISGALFTALLSVIKYMADPYDQLPAIVYWLLGGLAMVNGQTVLVVSLPIICGISLLLVLSRYLNVLTMGDEEARSLGVNVTVLRLVFIITATLISSLTVALAGIIGWVGLVIPHMGRMLVGPDNRILLPVVTIMGAVFLVVVDDISRLLFQVEIPLGILTSLLGVPVFALILKNARKGWG
ncbi:MAG: iron ABC transporter permease [Deltaproteobacteria bacterium]|nr:iron ABC transporter permease [Deltaproteobacteria bacterium]MBF0526900.1 iron ABC transporter permease [Deltaproteobacteria bacterium]